jgi:arylsulfatase A-like enzyme
MPQNRMRLGIVIQILILWTLLSPNSQAAQPNIVFILIDDMGWSDLSCFGGIRAQTPNIDRLAENGIRFRQFYVNAPICSPSRVAFTTGQYPHRWRISSYLDNRQTNNDRGMAQWLSTDAPVLARALQEAGYKTGHFGKWHMGGQRDVTDAPSIEQYGFQQSLTNFEGLGPKLLPLTQQPDWVAPRKIWEKGELLGGPVTWTARSKITTGFVDAAISFIDQAQANQQPFYLNLWPDDVHSPFFPSLQRWSGNKRKRYDAVLEEMDAQLKPLIDRIDNDARLRENTIVILCSDNGHEHGAGNSAPYRGAKTWLYEGGVRSPLIIYAPGLMTQEKRGSWNNESTFCALDVNRSLYSLSQLNPSASLDGEDLADVLVGKSNASRQAPIFWRRPPDRPGFVSGFDEPNPDLAVRSGNWKCYLDFQGQNLQLYDLATDISERHNIAAQHPEIAESLRQQTLRWNESMPADRPQMPRK